MKKPLNNTEQRVLDLYNQGMKQCDIVKAVSKDKGTVSKALKHIRTDYPELLTEQARTEPITQPVEVLPTVTEKAVCGADTDVKKQVFSFRASQADIKVWRDYARATKQTMETIGTAAMQEYLQNHKLTGAEKTIFDAYSTMN